MVSSTEKLIFVRHCLTDYDIAGPEGRFLGNSNPPLNENGLAEAKVLSEELKNIPFDKAYVGESKRCQQTLDFILQHHNIPKEINPLLNEINYGEWEGLTKETIVNQFAKEWNKFENDPELYIPPFGEKTKECADRAETWLNSAVCKYGLVVIDKTWLRLLICRILGIPLKYYRDVFDIKIASVTVLLTTKKGRRIEAINYSATKKRIYGITNS